MHNPPIPHPLSQRASPATWRTAAVFLALWLIYVALEALYQAGHILPPLSTALKFAPGLLGLAALFAAGFSASDCFLQTRLPSRKGLLALLLPLPLLVPVLLTGRWSGTGSACSLLVYAPAEALSQDLFFRSALLPAALWFLGGRALPAILISALLHGVWHVGPLVQGAGWGAALAVMLVPFVTSLAWNYHVQRDRTVLWVVLLHILIDQSITLFTWG